MIINRLLQNHCHHKSKTKCDVFSVLLDEQKMLLAFPSPPVCFNLSSPASSPVRLFGKGLVHLVAACRKQTDGFIPDVQWLIHCLHPLTRLTSIPLYSDPGVLLLSQPDIFTPNSNKAVKMLPPCPFYTVTRFQY